MNPQCDKDYFSDAQLKKMHDIFRKKAFNSFGLIGKDWYEEIAQEAMIIYLRRPRCDYRYILIDAVEKITKARKRKFENSYEDKLNVFNFNSKYDVEKIGKKNKEFKFIKKECLDLIRHTVKKHIKSEKKIKAFDLILEGNKTYLQIGKELGVSESRISQFVKEIKEICGPDLRNARKMGII